MLGRYLPARAQRRWPWCTSCIGNGCGPAGRRIQWVSIDEIVERHKDVDALAYPVEHGWIAVGPGRQSVTLTNAGRRLATAKG